MSSDLTRQCLNFEQRPETPPHIRKYRKSAYQEPGKRYQHHGVSGDYPQMQLDEKIYGRSEAIHTRETASDLIHQPTLSELQRMNKIKAESTYKHTQREPLGHSPDRHIQLPTKFTVGHEAFGVKTVSANEAAKDLIFPSSHGDETDGDELYKKSHGSYAPGEQKRRDYNWNIDPTQTRFGRKGDTIALNGISKNISDVLKGSPLTNDASVVNIKKVEDFRNMGNQLGQTKNLGQDSASRPRDMVYGKPSGIKGVSASDVIKGKYTPADTLPDRDLGKSITPGFRNVTLNDRAFGVPSIRSDIPHKDPASRSLADSQNYGDDLPAQDLITPPAFADMSIGPLAMSEPRSKERIMQLFSRVGYNLDPHVAEDLFYRASGGREETSINAFRNVLNDYILQEQILLDRSMRK